MVFELIYIFMPLPNSSCILHFSRNRLRDVDKKSRLFCRHKKRGSNDGYGFNNYVFNLIIIFILYQLKDKFKIFLTRYETLPVNGR